MDTKAIRRGGLMGGLAALLVVLPGQDLCTVPDEDCTDEIEALAKEMYAEIGSCTAVVRLDYQTYDLLGYQLFCGPYTRLSEKEARTIAESDTGYGLDAIMLNEPDPEDTWVFYEPPGDFGGVGAVSARNGLSVFGGSIVWMGTGDITYPTNWRPLEELGHGCDPAGGIPRARGYDLVSGGAPLSDAQINAALEVVLDTAIPGAFWEGGYVFDAVVLSYPRTMGAFNPNTAEWIVMVNGGWLE